MFPLPTICIGGAILGLWLIRQWSARSLGRVGHYVRLTVVLVLVAADAFLVVGRAFGRVTWFTYVLAAVLAIAAVWRETR